MSATVAAIRAALVDRLEDVVLPDSTTLRCSALWADQVAPPCVLITPDSPLVQWDLTMARGADLWGFKVVLLVARSTVVQAQELLDALLAPSGTSSIKQAVEASWPGTGAAAGIHYAECVRVENYGTLVVNDLDYLGCEFIVEVTA